jgi:hypothetical protein
MGSCLAGTATSMEVISMQQGAKMNRGSGVTTRALAAPIRTLATVNTVDTVAPAVNPVQLRNGPLTMENRASEEKPARPARVSIHRMYLQLAND